MVNNILWAAGTSGYLAVTTGLSTELNALANGSLSAASGAIDNSAGQKAIYVDVEFNAGGTFTPVTPAYMWVWFLRSIDGTNYEDGSSSVQPVRPPDAVVPITAGSSITPRNNRPQCVMPPGKFKVLALNKTGATLPATGNTIKLGLYCESVN